MKLSVIFITLFSFTSLAWNIPPQPKEAAYLAFKNKLINPGFENGSSNWTNSGASFTVTTTGADIGEGARSGVWDASAASQTLLSSNYTIEIGLRATNGLAQCRYRTDATDIVMQVHDGTNPIVEQTLSASSGYAQTPFLNFAFPGSGTVRIRFVSASNSAALYLDDCYLGAAYNIGSVSQAQFAGSAYFAQTANCSWSRTNTAIGAFGTDADCPAPTIDKQVVGSWQTTDADLPRITINALPPGIYKVTVTASMYGAGDWTMALSDGTSTRGYASGSGNGGGTFQPANVSTAWFEYTTSGNRTFEIHASSASGSVSLDNNANNDRTTFVIERYPLASQSIIGADQGDFGWTRDDALVLPSAGFGTVTNKYVFKKRIGDTLYVRGSFEAGTVAASQAFLDLVGVTINSGKLSTNTNSQRLGEYTLKQSSGTSTTNASNFGHADLFFDGSDTDSIYFATQTTGDQFVKFNPSGTFGNTDSFSFEFYVPIVGWNENQRAPQLVGSVTSNSAGAERIERAQVTTACSASPCTIASGNGHGWLTNITRDGTGDYNLNFVSGVFSAAPTCTIWPINNTGVLCHGSDNPSTTLQQFVCRNTAMTAFDSSFSIICIGPR